MIYLQYHPPFTNNPNWQPHGSGQAGDVSQISQASTIRDEVIEWMDPDSTKWDRRRRNIIGGISWAKLKIPRIVVEMDAITYDIIWPREAETCANYRPQDMDLLASAVNKIAKVQEMPREDPQPRRWLWAEGEMIGDASAPGPMRAANRIKEYKADIEVDTVKGARERYKASLRRPAPPNTQAYQSEHREFELQKLFTTPKTSEERRAQKEAKANMFGQPTTSTAVVGARMNTGGGSRKRASPKRVAAYYGVSSQRPSPKAATRAATASRSQQGVQTAAAEAAKRSASDSATGKEAPASDTVDQAERSEPQAETPLPLKASSDSRPR